MARHGVLTLIIHNAKTLYPKHLVNKKLAWYIHHSKLGDAITARWYHNELQGYTVRLATNESNHLVLIYKLYKSYTTHFIIVASGVVTYRFMYKGLEIEVVFSDGYEYNMEITVPREDQDLKLGPITYCPGSPVGSITVTHPDYRQQIMDDIMQKIVKHKIEEFVIRMIELFVDI